MLEKPVIVGLCGGIASGKTTVARMFKKLGARIIDADRIGHRVLEKTPVKKVLLKRYGKRIISQTNRIDREQLGAISFSRRKHLKELNRLVHPFIQKEIQSQIKRSLRKREVIILDAALLMETGLSRICSLLIFVDSKKGIRQARISEKRGWDQKEAEQREIFQMSPETKKGKADFIINNNNSLKTTWQQAKNIFSEIQEKWR